MFIKSPLLRHQQKHIHPYIETVPYEKSLFLRTCKSDNVGRLLVTAVVQLVALC
jgi:hypothetical protein